MIEKKEVLRLLEISKDAALIYIFAELNISNKETVRHLNISPAAFRELKTNIGSPKENQSKKVDTERWDYLIPLTHQDPVFISTFHEFVAMRKEIKKPIISEIGVKKLMNTLSGYTVEEGIEAGFVPAFFCCHYKLKSAILNVKETL